jgi:hypothetical protein
MVMVRCVLSRVAVGPAARPTEKETGERRVGYRTEGISIIVGYDAHRFRLTHIMCRSAHTDIHGSICMQDLSGAMEHLMDLSEASGRVGMEHLREPCDPQ